MLSLSQQSRTEMRVEPQWKHTRSSQRKHHRMSIKQVKLKRDIFRARPYQGNLKLSIALSKWDQFRVK